MLRFTARFLKKALFGMICLKKNTLFEILCLTFILLDVFFSGGQLARENRASREVQGIEDKFVMQKTLTNNINQSYNE